MHPTTSVNSMTKNRGKVINNEFYALITPKNNLLIKRVLFLLLTFYDNKVS